MSDNAAPLILSEFLPYRLSVLANRISRDLSRLYAERFGLAIPEWRAIAVLGRHPGIAADELCQRTAMDKVAVSRAVRRLLDKGLVRRRTDRSDRRRGMLSLSARGKATYRRIVPLALGYERLLLSRLDPASRDGLERVLHALDQATKTESLPQRDM